MSQLNKIKHRGCAFTRYVGLFLIGFFFFGLASTLLHAKSQGSANKLIEYLVQEKIRLSLAVNEIKAVNAPINYKAYLEQKQGNETKNTFNNARIVNFDSFMTNQKQLQQELIQRLKRFQQIPLSTNNQLDSQEQIEEINRLLYVDKKTLDLIQEDLLLAKQFQNELSLQKQKLSLWLSKAQMESRLELLRTKQVKLTDSLDRLYENSIKLQQEKKLGDEPNKDYLIEAKLSLNNQIISLTQYQIAEIGMQKRLVKADYLLLKNPDLRTLQKVTDIYKNAVNQLSEIEKPLKKMAMILSQQHQHAPAELKEKFKTLTGLINTRLEEIAIYEQTLQEDLENHQKRLQKQLSVRQSLSDYSLKNITSIINQLINIPNQFYNYLKSLFVKLKDNYLWQDKFPSTFMWILILFIAIGTYLLQRLFKSINQEKMRSRLSGHLYDGFLVLVSENLIPAAILTTIVLIFFLNHILFANYQLLVHLFLVWIIFRSLISIARRALLERISDSSGGDVRLYYRLKWLLLTGGWTTGLMVISHQLTFSAIVQDIFNRLFMVFLLAVSIVSWRSKEVIGHLLEPVLHKKKRYLQNAARLLTILIPFTLLTTAVIGLAGYINLASSMSLYEIQILLILTGYVLARGLLIDALELLSEGMISFLKNGWLWIEVFLKPIDKIFRLLLVSFTGYLLFQLFGLGVNTPIIAKILLLGDYPLINVSGIHITPLSILAFVILVSIFTWISKWTREFAYRWMYKEVRDAGIRNSISVFTQYAVILLGGFITLRVLGFDFSGLTMVIGGLAVGMGFGLRDFASNVVGGLMLLIERPVREGDLITLGDYEGRVAHIGIRSMRVSSWDNMEVLIPNAETFNKPFTNWTHQDGIVRTVIPIKVSRCDDPVLIQQLIFDVLAVVPEIVAEPPPQVLLKQIDEALIEFEVRYFINVQLHTRFEIRSKVLFAITAQFKASGVKPPIPPIAVEIKDNSNESIISKTSTEK